MSTGTEEGGRAAGLTRKDLVERVTTTDSKTKTQTDTTSEPASHPSFQVVPLPGYRLSDLKYIRSHKLCSSIFSILPQQSFTLILEPGTLP